MNFLLLAAEGATELPMAVSSGTNWFLEHAWIVPLLPALSFVIILFFGKRMPKKGAEVGIAAVGLAFIFAVITGVAWIDHRDNFQPSPAAEHAVVIDGSVSVGDQVVLAAAETPVDGVAAEGTVGEAGAEAEAEHPTVAIHKSTTWLHNNGVGFDAGILVDGLSVLMLFVVTLVSLLVHVYSTDYVAGDRGYTHFFAFLSLFTASMLFFVLSDNILQMVVGWELVGVCSFVLIGHWWEEKANSDAAMKAFLTNRVGDTGLLIGVIILFFTAGNGSFDTLTINSNIVNGGVSHTALVVAAMSLTAAVMSKSGQFILHTWLPDAMAGPTPVSALIHAATMVVAGIYMVARLYPVFFEGMQIGGSSINLLAVVGAITLVFGGLLAFVQNDIKKVLAYSTISQLGYMAMALGVGAWTAAIFHLFTHAFFKACLFLGAGSASHAVHSFDMKKDMGGLKKWMPHTYRTFVVASLALAGVFPLAGFWSKDEILSGTGGWGLFGGTGGNGSYTFMLVMGTFGAALTGAYMTRVIYLTFHGEFRGHGTPHENGRRIIVPLYVLATVALLGGLVNLPPGFITGNHSSWQERFGHYVEPVAGYFPHIAHATPSYSLAIASSLVAFAGIGYAYWYYFVKLDNLAKATGESLTELPDGFVAKSGVARAGHTLLVQKYYLDHLYTDIIAGTTKGAIARAANWVNQNVIDGTVDLVGRTSVKAGRFTYDKIDQPIIDGIVNASGSASNAAGDGFRIVQTGKIQQYAALLFAGAALLGGVLVIVLSL